MASVAATGIIACFSSLLVLSPTVTLVSAFTDPHPFHLHHGNARWPINHGETHVRAGRAEATALVASIRRLRGLQSQTARNSKCHRRIRKRTRVCSTTHRTRVPPLVDVGSTVIGGRVPASKSSLVQQHHASTTMNSDTIVCDQCGEIDLGVDQHVLTVCNAPGCGLAFAQCQRCKADYEGCCSTACQTLAVAADNPRNGGDIPRGNGGPGNPRHQPAGSSLRRPRLLDLSNQPPTVTYDSPAQGEEVYDFVSSVGEMKRVGHGDLLEAVRAAGNSSDDRDASAATRNHAKILEGGINDGGLPSVDSESYASRYSVPESPCLARVREATSRAQPHGAHMVSGHLQGELLKLLTRLCSARRVLDIGTFTGYSAIAFAEALPEDGVVVTLEADARAAEAASFHFKSSSDGHKIELMLGKAMDSMEKLIQDKCPQFDVIFIDADKKRYWDYYEKALAAPRPLLSPTGILLADNVLFHDLVPLAEALEAEDVYGPETEPRNVPTTRGYVEGKVPSGASARETGSANAASDVTPRRWKIAKSLNDFNRRVAEDDRVQALMLPIRDGLSVVRWKDGSYPNPSQ